MTLEDGRSWSSWGNVVCLIGCPLGHPGETWDDVIKDTGLGLLDDVMDVIL